MTISLMAQKWMGNEGKGVYIGKKNTTGSEERFSAYVNLDDIDYVIDFLMRIKIKSRHPDYNKLKYDELEAFLEN